MALGSGNTQQLSEKAQDSLSSCSGDVGPTPSKSLSLGWGAGLGEGCPPQMEWSGGGGQGCVAGRFRGEQMSWLFTGKDTAQRQMLASSGRLLWGR